MTFRCGLAAIVGRPNVGKSTLLNKLLGQKVSITSPKPQTTRHIIRGIKTLEDAQIIYVDTPGIHRNAKRALNRAMNRSAVAVLADVDVIVMVVEALRWTDEDEMVLEDCQRHGVPLLVVINKVDTLKEKTQLLPHLKWLSEKTGSQVLVPAAALTGDNVAAIEKEIIGRLPEQAAFYSDDQITDRSMRFFASEILREKLMRKLEAELPYGIAVEIETFTEKPNLLEINAAIWVEKESHKPIVIGKQGAMLKAVGTDARRDMEKMFEQKVLLHLWVRVKEGWADNDRLVQKMGIDSEKD